MIRTYSQDISCSEKTPSGTSAETFQSSIYQKMQMHFNGKEKFAFHQFQQDKVIRIIKELPKNKVLTFKDIPVKIMVHLVHICTLKSSSHQKILMTFVKSGNFPDTVKPVYMTASIRRLLV